MNHYRPILLLQIGVRHCEFLNISSAEIHHMANIKKKDHTRRSILNHIRILHHTLHHHNYPQDAMYLTTTILTG